MVNLKQNIKKLALVGCVCIIGLILISILYFSWHPPTIKTENYTGTLLNNNTPDNGFYAMIEVVEPDGMKNTFTVTPSENGVYSLPVLESDTIKKIMIYHESDQVISYGPPFDPSHDYGVNINVPGGEA